ncbi:hypothetical protein AGMMS49532_05280 [Endomicrobiia bacterium]|uniref:hypothetical protein n=1 Tax=Endomicrobium trichonymphae TaxID=1408204 RepID=UPI001556A1BD|nr:hypothetical protein [Candidatus Endomicrobium trichonymphae]GHT08904.1 hypothetical protein AGMMS49532_05280 [Endomicrobiia bacterium]GHT22975.1 hypothetical protein AGMMS49953_02740 [Endomicrobiia bacterium]
MDELFNTIVGKVNNNTTQEQIINMLKEAMTKNIDDNRQFYAEEAMKKYRR